MRRLTGLLLLIFLLISPLPAAAQTGLELDTLRIDIWPEYDQPSVLVIYRFTLAADTALPAQVSMRIPADAGEPYNVAMKDVDGMLYTLSYTTRLDGDWLWVDFSSTSAEVQLEYYDARLHADGAARHFTYTWPGDFTVHDVNVIVQQPLHAAEMAISGLESAGTPGSDGMTYYAANFGALQQGEGFSLEMDYTNASGALSAVSQPVMPVQALEEGAGQRTSFLGVLPWVLGGFGLLLILFGGWWYVRTVKGAPGAKKRRHTPRRSEVEAPYGPPASGDGPAPVEGAVYCHQCGKRAGSGDVFCRACGSKLRHE